MDLAEAAGCRSVAFPAISTGVYGYPSEAAAEVAVDTLSAWLEGREGWEVTLVAFDTRTAEILGKALER
jgi:O-acetyl-ADP-ribose deacetylase (regulator of RNase III)